MCPACDRPVGDGARFCASCGTALQQDTTQVPAATVTAATAVVEDDDDLLFPVDDVDATPDLGGPTAASGRPDAATGHAADDDAPIDRAPVAPPAEAATTTCPGCGATNSSARMLCGRCGVDLVTGEQPVADVAVVQPGPAIDVAGDVDVADRRVQPRTMLVVGAIVVVGAIIGIAVGVWAVSAGQDADVAAPVFDPAVYPGEPADLRVSGVGASSTRSSSGGASHDAATMVDGDPATAWSHDPANQPAVEVDLAFAFEQPAWVTDVVVANGAQADRASFAADARVRRMLLVVDGDQVAELQFGDIEGFQQARLPAPVLAQTVRFRIVEVYDGDTFDEVSLSEVSFLGHEAIGADRDRVEG